MAKRNANLHGFVPDKSETVLILIDVINDLDFPECEQLLPAALTMAQRLKAFKDRARRAGIPSIYVNDNFGRWQSNFHKHIDHCLRPGSRGRELVRLLRPHSKDYYVLKPKHSGFFSTTLEILLRYLQAKTLILTGLAANICVLFTANDAYLRDYKLIVPRDCVASNTAAETEYALNQMEQLLRANVDASSEIRFPSKGAKRKRKSLRT